MDKLKEFYENVKEWWIAPRIRLTSYLVSFIEGFFIGSGLVAWFWVIVFWLVSFVVKLKLKFAK